MAKLNKLAIPALVATAALAAGCGAGGNGAPSSTGGGGGQGGGGGIPAVSKDAKLAAKVPSAIAKDGKLTIANDQTYAPNEFKKNGTLVGMDVDLGRAIAQKLGLKAEYVNSSFDGILGGILAKKYEAGMSSFSINKERLQQVSMVSYFTAGTSFATLKGNPDKLSVDNLCGKTIAVQKGTTQVEDLQDRDKKCKQQGKPAINKQQFQAQTDVTLALNAKRAQGELADSPVIDYTSKKTSGQIQRVGESYANAPYGVAVAKNDKQLATALQGAIQSLMDDGTYKKILDKWGVSRGAIQRSEVNPQVAG